MPDPDIEAKEIARVIPVEGIGVTYYTVSIGSLGIKLYEDEWDATELCDAINAAIAPALIAAREQGEKAATVRWATPEGEDARAYNAQDAADIWRELIGPVERERLDRTPWARSLVGELLQRIVNLRKMAATAEQRGCEQGYEQGLKDLEGRLKLDKSTTITDPEYHYNLGWNDAVHDVAGQITALFAVKKK